MINDLVEAITAPFLEGLDESINVTPKEEVVEIKKTIEEQAIDLKGLMSNLGMDAISQLGSQVPQALTIDFIKSSPGTADSIDSVMRDKPKFDSEGYPSWKQRGQDMANKIGYELIDYIDGDKKITNPDVDMGLSDEESFVDITGELCEELSHRLKIRSIIAENIKKKS